MNLKTRIRSVGIRKFTSAGYLEGLRKKARKARARSGQPPTVHYFHQSDDPYSHLAVQKLDALKGQYDLAFVPHLVSKPEADYQGSAKHFDAWAIEDCKRIASFYDTQFDPLNDEPPGSGRVAQANRALAAQLSDPSFASAAIDIGNALWRGEPIVGAGNDSQVAESLDRGDKLRAQLGHYQGGMFYFEGEWFWGIDRIRSLEQRLIDENFSSENARILVPQPVPPHLERASAASVTLEYFPSLRSPYTAIGHQRVLEVIDRTGVNVNVRPVMPMLMRGVKAPREKQLYIATDSGREARAFGVPFGKIVDPFGAPVRKAFALFPGAIEQGKPMEFVTAYLAAAWHEGVDISTDKGLQLVADKAGLNWNELKNYADSSAYEALLADNLEAMLSENLWGVPSFRVSGGNRPDDTFACWGQDRIWRVEAEINSRSGSPR